MKATRTFFSCIFLFLSLISPAQEDKFRAVNGFRLDLDQDFFLELAGAASLNEDRNYTQGFGLAVFSPGFTDFWVRNKITPNFTSLDTNQSFFMPAEFTFQFAGFTPDNLRDSLPIIGDRPYSSVFFLGLKFTVLNARKYQSRQRGFYAGALGLDGPARDIQTAIHKGQNNGNTRPPYNPMGWHNQVCNGGEPTAMYSDQFTRLLTRKKLNVEIGNGKKIRKQVNIQLTYGYGYSVGYLTQLSSGMSMRLGLLDLSNWHSDLFNQMGAIASAPKNNPQFSNKQLKDYYELPKQGEIYFFASVQPFLTFFNSSLHGQFRKSIYHLDYGQTGFLNAQARLGIGFTSTYHTLAIFTAFKSPDMWNSFSRIHTWGGFSLAIKWKHKKNGNSPQ